MPRNISAATRSRIEEPESSEQLVILLIISHGSLSEPIRVANDIVDYAYDGETYIGFPFEIELVSDNDEVPVGRLTVQNIDQRISDALLELVTPPQVTVMIVAGRGFSAPINNVRQEIGTAPLEYMASNLMLGNTTVDASSIQAEIRSYDLTAEPWPAIRTTTDKLPGLSP